MVLLITGARAHIYIYIYIYIYIKEGQDEISHFSFLTNHNLITMHHTATIVKFTLLRQSPIWIHKETTLHNIDP